MNHLKTAALQLLQPLGGFWWFQWPDPWEKIFFNRIKKGSIKKRMINHLWVETLHHHYCIYPTDPSDKIFLFNSFYTNFINETLLNSFLTNQLLESLLITEIRFNLFSFWYHKAEHCHNFIVILGSFLTIRAWKWTEVTRLTGR